ncbi:MAG: sigma-54-dependent Fis family transcriptional regulator [Nitrospina sp.]|jgi:DNA-binding NtrC family response regulator|nr:sigma-54-dependent Fis family transcriptional regulator [Nitrospina sp.]MBT5631340.1 sigma-54-dependent Fis family transcriptional regulator [Nitrospina sp.]
MKHNASRKILIVDDESEMRVALETTLKREDYQLVCAEDGKQALDQFENQEFDLVLTDVRMPKLSGLELLRAVKDRSPKTPVVMMTAYGTIDNAVEAMKEGAFDYLIKGSGFSADVLVSTVKRAFLNPQDYVPPARPTGIIDKTDSIVTKKIVTQNEEMKKLLSFAENVAYSKSTVLIMGETGTGKELFARYIHQCSPRSEKSFMAVNCAALPEGLLESELFGHEKGSFTGATENKEGKFQLANQSSLLLDEVTEMSLPLQAKLLRVLQEHEVDKVGGRAPIPVDVRVIATTNRDIRRRIQDKEFREDLYYRLNVIPLNLIPLRERKDDIPMLAEHFMNQFCQENSRNPFKIDPATLTLLKKYRWPGNIRELGNIIERTCLMCQGDTLLPSHLFFDEELPSSGKKEANFTGTIYEMEKELILQTLEEVSGNKTKAAESLGISIRTLRNKLNEYNEGE